jgi:hypothetical protein
MDINQLIDKELAARDELDEHIKEVHDMLKPLAAKDFDVDLEKDTHGPLVRVSRKGKNLFITRTHKSGGGKWSYNVTPSDDFPCRSFGAKSMDTLKQQLADHIVRYIEGSTTSKSDKKK